MKLDFRTEHTYVSRGSVLENFQNIQSYNPHIIILLIAGLKTVSNSFTLTSIYDTNEIFKRINC